MTVDVNLFVECVGMTATENLSSIFTSDVQDSSPRAITVTVWVDFVRKSWNRMSLGVYDRNSLQEAEVWNWDPETLSKMENSGNADVGKDREHRPSP